MYMYMYIYVCMRLLSLLLLLLLCSLFAIEVRCDDDDEGDMFKASSVEVMKESFEDVNVGGLSFVIVRYLTF